MNLTAFRSGLHLQTGDLLSACAAIRKVTRDPTPNHPRTREVYAHYSRNREARVLSREDQSLLAKLRSGHYVGLRAHRARVDGGSDPTCDLFGLEPQTLENFLHTSPATAAVRRNQPSCLVLTQK